MPSIYSKESYGWIALSSDLLVIYPIGSEVYIEGIPFTGKYCVVDKMGIKMKNRVDILIKRGELNVSQGLWKLRIRKI